jgi:uncharacterized protein YggL (DUF469 family)
MTTRPYLRPALGKRRSRRLRKKLHIAEFQELGFEYEITWHRDPTPEQQDSFLDAWIGLVESRDLVLGGGPTSGFVCGFRKNACAADIQLVHDFLTAWPGIARVTIGTMVDAWYGDPTGMPT